MKDNLNEIITETSKNLMKSSIFFVSSNLIDLLKLKHDQDLVSLTNKLYLIDENGRFNEANNKNVWNIVLKKGLLNENIFLLYNLKDQYGEDSFKYVVEKYGEQVEAFLFISNWLKLHTIFHIKELSEEQNKALQAQYNLYLNHKQDFEKKFKITTNPNFDPNGKTAQTVVKNFKAFVPELNQSVDSSNQAKASLLQLQQTTTMGLDKKSRLNKLKNDIEKEADIYVLNTVFNVKIKE